MSYFGFYLSLVVVLIYFNAIHSCTVKITNLNDNDVFNHQLVIFNGQIDDEVYKQDTIRNISVINKHIANYDSIIDTRWPINSLNQFKGLIKLQNGSNNLVFTYGNPRNEKCSLTLTLIYEQNLLIQPLHLVIVAGSDSELVYDVEPGEDNNYESAIKKYRVMAWFWQAFIDDQLYKNGYGHRSFRLDETELINGEYYPNIHLLRAPYTVEQIRNGTVDLFQMCNDVISSSYFSKLKPADIALQSACLIMDSHKLPGDNDQVLAHAALGNGWLMDYNQAIFGSHLLYSQPASLKDIKSSFYNRRKVNTYYTSTDGRKYWDYWGKINNFGIGGFLKVIGHSLGLFANNGIMTYGFEQLNFAISSIELDSNNTWDSVKTGIDDIVPAFSKEDCAILSVHPLLRFESEAYSFYYEIYRTAHLVTTSKTSFSLFTKAFISFIGFYDETWSMYIQSFNYSNAPTNVSIDMSKYSNLMKYKTNNKAVKLIVFLKNGGFSIFDDIFNIVESSVVYDKVFKTRPFGSNHENQVDFMVNFYPAPNVKVVEIKVYYDDYVHGMDFVYSNKSVISVGYNKSKAVKSVNLTTQQIREINVKSTDWLDVIQFCYSDWECTDTFGGVGGSNYDLINLYALEDDGNNYKISGISGASIEKYGDETINVLNVITVFYEKM